MNVAETGFGVLFRESALVNVQIQKDFFYIRLYISPNEGPIMYIRCSFKFLILMC
jgi:hypothetical protein